MQENFKVTFDDPGFRAMSQAYYIAGGGRGTAPVLTTKGHKARVDAEYGAFRTFARFSIEHRRSWVGSMLAALLPLYSPVKY